MASDLSLPRRPKTRVIGEPLLPVGVAIVGLVVSGYVNEALLAWGCFGVLAGYSLSGSV